MDEYQEYLRLFGDLPFGMRPDFDTYKKQVSAQTARDTLTQGIAEGDLDKAYKEGFEKLPLMDQLLYGVAPVTGEALATYEIPEFKERGDTARKEGRKLDAAGNYLVSGLNLLSMVPVVGKAAGVAGDLTRMLGRGTRAKTEDGMGGGAKLPPPTSTPTAFETQITAGIKNNENVYTSRPATTVIEESVVNNPKFKKLYPNPDKPYEIDNMLTLMGKYGGDNRNVKEQIDLYVSPELKAKGKVTTRELLNDIADNKPRFTEYKARYEELPALTNNIREAEYVYNSPFISKYNNPTTITEAQARKAPIDYEHKSFYINPNKEGQTYNITNTTHPEVSQGLMPNRTASENKVFHSRQYTYNIDGKIVSIPAEGQSGAYKMFEKAEDVPYNFSEFDMGLESVVEDIAIDAEQPILKFLRDNNFIESNAGSLNPTVLVSNARYTGDGLLDNAFIPEFTLDGSFMRNIEKQIDAIPDTEIDKQLQKYFDSVEYDVKPTEEMRSDYRNFIRDYSIENIGNIRDIATAGRRYSVEEANNANIRRQEVKENFIENLQSEMNIAVENYDPKKLPLFNEWFNVHMKTSLQDAANSGVDEVWFPVNDYAVARQRGETLATTQALQLQQGVDYDGIIPEVSRPSKGATEMAKKYKKFTEKGLNSIERDYGVKLNAELFTDANNQEFYKINLTPELKDELSTLKLNRGGLATLMPLRY